MIDHNQHQERENDYSAKSDAANHSVMEGTFRIFGIFSLMEPVHQGTIKIFQWF